MQQPFDDAVSAHGVTVLRVCRAVLGATTHADDAWSETFLAALRAWDRLPDDANVEGWLVTIAHRKAIDAVRARNRHAIPVAEVPAGGRSVQGMPARLDDPGDDTRLHPDVAVWAALSSLPPRQRDSVALHHVAGLPHAEAAAALGTTATAVRKASSDGIRRLRAILAVEEQSNE